MPHPLERDGQFKVGAVYGGAHGRLVLGDDREHCTCGWVSRQLTEEEQRDRATVVWQGHLVLNGPWSPSPEFQQRVRDEWDLVMREKFAKRNDEWKSATRAKEWLRHHKITRRTTS
jgi:hypothetical protein